jgi:hypothetical protein
MSFAGLENRAVVTRVGIAGFARREGQTDRLSKSDKKITSALTYEGTDRPFVKSAGQDCKASG